MDLTQVIEDLKSTRDILYGLDAEKKFSLYLGLRELAFCFAVNLVSDKDAFQEITHHMARALEDFMLIDKALTNNLYHYINIKFSSNISLEQKTYLIENIDHFMKPRENKQNPTAHRFAAGCLTYKLSSQNNLTSKDEARALSAYMFKLSDTEVRNCAKQFEKSYKQHVLEERHTSALKAHVIDMLLFMIISDLLDERKESFDDLFIKYQDNSNKRKETTAKTHHAYKTAMLKSFSEIKPNTDFNHFPSMEVKNSDIFPDWKDLREIEPDRITEKQLYKLHAFVNPESLTTQ